MHAGPQVDVRRGVLNMWNARSARMLSHALVWHVQRERHQSDGHVQTAHSHGRSGVRDRAVNALTLAVSVLTVMPQAAWDPNAARQARPTL